MDAQLNDDVLLEGILENKLPINQQGTSIVIVIKVKGGSYRSLNYKSMADARDDRKNLVYIKFKYPLTRNVRSYGQRQVSAGPHQITPDFITSRDAYMKALVEEHKKSSPADMDIDGQQNDTHKDLEEQLESVDMSGVHMDLFYQQSLYFSKISRRREYQLYYV